MKGLSTIDPDTIRKHQTNNSSSKNAYQFSKTKRFPDPNPEYKHLHSDAKLPSTPTKANYPDARLLLAMGPSMTLLENKLPVLAPQSIISSLCLKKIKPKERHLD